jgi:hypothetical protein
VEERAIGAEPARREAGVVMECGRRRFPVIEIASDGCLIEPGDGGVPRGLVDIFDGERHMAQCLIVLAEPQGRYLRCTFKRWTPSRLGPPQDFA